jgi:hypothetical protein
MEETKSQPMSNNATSAMAYLRPKPKRQMKSSNEATVQSSTKKDEPSEDIVEREISLLLLETKYCFCDNEGDQKLKDLIAR